MADRMTEALDRVGRARLARATLLAGAVMVFERLLLVAAPFGVAALALAAAALWGLFETAERTFVLASFGGAVVLAGLAALRNLLRFRWPTADEIRRRVEADSGLAHAPLTALADAPATGDERLWDLHRRRAAEAARRARVGAPRATLSAADPFAIRYLAALSLVLGFWSQGSAGVDRARALFEFGPIAAAPALAASSYRKPEAQLLAEAARAIRAEREPYAAAPGATAGLPAWYEAATGLERAPDGVKDAADMLAGFDPASLDAAARIGVGWAQRRLSAAETLDEAKAVAAELDRMALRLERGGAADVRNGEELSIDGRV